MVNGPGKTLPEDIFRVVPKDQIPVNGVTEKELGRKLLDWWLLRREKNGSFTLLADYANQDEAQATRVALVLQRSSEESSLFT